MNRQEKIDRYLRGQLPPEETTVFEQELSADTALAREVELHRLEHELLLQLEADALRAKIRELRAGEGSKPQGIVRELRQRPTLGWRWKITAAAAALVALVVAVWYFAYPYPEDELVAEGYGLAPPDYAGQIMSGGDAASVFDPAVIEILEKRDRRRAETAVRYFTRFQTTDPVVRRRAQFNRAHALLLAGRFNEAAAALEELERAGADDAPTQEAAQYYRALALLGKQDVTNARLALETIAKQPAHRYRTPASALLEKL